MDYFLPTPDDWCYYPPFYPSGPASTASSSGESTPVFDTSDGVPCLVPASMMPRSMDEDVDLDVDPFNASPMTYYSEPSRYPTHHPFCSEVPCVPGVPFADGTWTPTTHCVPEPQQPTPELGRPFSDTHASQAVEQSCEGHRASCFNVHDTDIGFTASGTSGKPVLPKCIRDPNVLPVVDLTKSEMEILSIQDFKDQKLDYFQRKTKEEKSTVLVVCIDQGMCAAFHLPKDDAKSTLNEQDDTDVTESAMPSLGETNLKDKEKDTLPHLKPQGREYLSVKKSLDKIFPSCAGNRSDVDRVIDSSLFAEDGHQVFLNSVCDPENDEAVQDIPDTVDMFDYE